MKVKEILEMVENHEISVDEAAILIDNPIDYATIDYNRKRTDCWYYKKYVRT